MLPKSDWTSVALGPFALAPTEDGRWRRRRRRRAPSSRIVWHGMACRLALSHIHRHDESRTTTDTTDREEVSCSHDNHQSSIIKHQSFRHHHYYYNDNHNKNNLQLRPGMAMLPGSLHRSSLLAVQDHARSQKGRLRLFSLARSPILHASTLARLVSKLVPAMPLKAMRMTMLPPKALTCCQCTVRQGHPMPRGLTVVR